MPEALNGDAFSDEIKKQTITAIKEDLGQIDCLIYSLASPRRVHPKTGEVFKSTLKPIGDTYSNKTLDAFTKKVSDITLEPANEDEVNNTVAVMGGEDWVLWTEALKEAGVLAENFTTLAYSYLGPEITRPIYRQGTIGAAKKDLEKSVEQVRGLLTDLKGQAWISVNKALITQASSAIPVIPLYMSLLYRVMKDKNVHEGCIEQINRLYRDKIVGPKVDEDDRIRLDDWELRDDVQEEVNKLWVDISTENISERGDMDGYQEDFLRLFGFGFSEVDYDADIDPVVNIPSIKE